MTRAEAKEVFNHILNTVLDRGDSSSLKSSLLVEGIADIFDLITITDDIIDSLAYEDPDDPRKFYPVKKGDKMLLRCFLAYQRYLESESNDFDYKIITQSNFDNFRISPAYRATIHQPDQTPSSYVPAPSTTYASSNTSL